MLNTLRKIFVSVAIVSSSVLVGVGPANDDGGPGFGEVGEITKDDLYQASRFASQSTFGLPYAKVEELAETGRAEWLLEQFELPPTFHTPVAEDLITRQDEGEWEEFVENPLKLRTVIHRFAWWQQTMTAEDVVRQRVAYALSQFFVVSDRDTVLLVNPYSMTSYYDLLLEHAFGNFRDLLKNVALSPAMGHYLSHANNSKAFPAQNTFPDQNFAREVMQLFSIGLYELNIDGTLKLDADGAPIPTYDNEDIEEMAKIFTGLTYDGEGHYWGRWSFDHADKDVFSRPMIMYEDYHEPSEKVLLKDHVIPAGQAGMQDIEDAIDVLFNHPNVAPFFCKFLIQRLVTSNPSPAYVERVARIFNGEQGTPRGDMQTVLQAVLFDVEALLGSRANTFGHLKEPAVRVVALARMFNYTSDSGEYYNTGYLLDYFTNQHPMSSPTVFNFYQSSYAPVGEIADRQMVAPEFQITNATTIVGLTNQIAVGIFNENQVFHTFHPHFEVPRIDLLEYREIAADPGQLMDRLDTLLTQGEMSAETRDVVVRVLEGVENLDHRSKIAIYLVMTSSDYAVED